MLYYFAWLVVASIVTFALYGFDKHRARTGGWRVPELVLHWCALLGGYIGGWAGREIFRHKTKKISFTVVLFLATALHVFIIYWFFVR